MSHRNTFSQAFLLSIMILAVLAPPFVFAGKTMYMQATLNQMQREQGVSVVIVGKVFDASSLPVSNAVVSIQVTNPQATSIHLDVAYSATDGSFQDNFLIPLDSPGGNYTAYLVADKPGYDTARVTLGFSYLSPDFSLQPSVSVLSLRQGDAGKFTLTLFSIRGFNSPVNLTAANLPSGVVLQFSPASVTPSGNTQATVTVSETASMGNYTMILLAVSGTTVHTTSIQLVITPGPIEVVYAALSVVIVIVILTGTLLMRRRRFRKKAAVRELLKASEADKGYVATARVIARLEELRATGQVDESTYQKLKSEYERRLKKSK